MQSDHDIERRGGKQRGGAEWVASVLPCHKVVLKKDSMKPAIPLTVLLMHDSIGAVTVIQV